MINKIRQFFNLPNLYNVIKNNDIKYSFKDSMGNILFTITEIDDFYLLHSNAKPPNNLSLNYRDFDDIHTVTNEYGFNQDFNNNFFLLTVNKKDLLKKAEEIVEYSKKFKDLIDKYEKENYKIGDVYEYLFYLNPDDILSYF